MKRMTDGRAFHHFMKSWASICRTGRFLEQLEPLHSRAEVEDTYGLEQNFLEAWWNWGSKQGISNNPYNQFFDDNVRTTIILSQSQIQNLKNWVSHHYKNELAAIHISTFVVICSLTWVCLVKSKNRMINYLSHDKLCYCLMSADCRNRLEFSIPLRYFGNCLALCYVPLQRKELVGEFGFVQAMKSIGTKIIELDGGAFKGAKEWMQIRKQIMDLGHQLMMVDGSPKFGVYKTDFGWGKLKKTEMVHVEIPGIISLAESTDEEDGGIEVGLALPRVQMDNFNVILTQYLALKS